MLLQITFAQPLAFLLLLPLVYAAWYYRQQKNKFLAPFTLSSTEGIRTAASWRSRAMYLLPFLTPLALALLVVALARPQNQFSEEKVTADGIDIVIAMDISGSMKAQDFSPDRLEASKNIASEFVNLRLYDRIGIVVFAGESFTQCPLTTDKSVLDILIKQIQNGILEDGTAIGMGLATAVNRLSSSQSASKVVILLTDGVNNAGFIDPATAAETAKQYGIKVYTIGVGTNGKAPYPTQTIFGNTVLQYMDVQIDEPLLKQIASLTGGKYFRATDNTELRKIYQDIDQLEKTKIEVTNISRQTEKFRPFVLAALALIALEWLLQLTLLRRLN